MIRPRTVILSIEIETDMRLSDLKKLPASAFLPWSDIKVHQVQANVAKGKKKHK